MKALTNLGQKYFFETGMNDCAGVWTMLVSAAKRSLWCFADDWSLWTLKRLSQFTF